MLGVNAIGGQRHESTELESLTDQCELGLDRYNSHPDAIAGDKENSGRSIRDRLSMLGVEPVIGTKSNERLSDNMIVSYVHT